MILKRENVEKLRANNAIQFPDEKHFELPEKVLQFGTGVLLRGLPDYFIDKANRAGIFNGRVVVVKSTDKGDTSGFDEQDSLYTLCIRGITDGKHIEENIISSAISRVVAASENWNAVLEVSADPALEIIISNTTEVGIQLVEDDIFADPPVSFPGKLLAVLYKRYQAFDGNPAKGLVIVPTELILDNGTKLRSIVLKLAVRNNIPEAAIAWIADCNTFCNSLVDRIVPGKPKNDVLKRLEEQLGFEDNLLIISESYTLWAIEGDEKVANVLSFAKADEGVVITPDINLHRELKLRLLNGTHTLSCAAAFLAGFSTVTEAMEDAAMSAFISDLMTRDIASAIPYDVSPDVASAFGKDVLDRFRNPDIEHQWLGITMNFTAKLKMRVLPVLRTYFEKFGKVPEHIAFGFAAYISFMSSAFEKDGKFFGSYKDNVYQISDEEAIAFVGLAADGHESIVHSVISNVAFWETDLQAFPDFEESVRAYFNKIQTDGVMEALKDLQNNIVSI
ncbi:MAG TPA: tagaturonate reductase [Daejeonella sp.]|nr:tagaturonate reductase [Daejeonella sp.]